MLRSNESVSANRAVHPLCILHLTVRLLYGLLLHCFYPVINFTPRVRIQGQLGHSVLCNRITFPANESTSDLFHSCYLPMDDETNYFPRFHSHLNIIYQLKLRSQQLYYLLHVFAENRICSLYPLGTEHPLCRTGVSLLSRESFFIYLINNIFHYLIFA